jgi:Protein of unknown function (DUF2934)
MPQTQSLGVNHEERVRHLAHLLWENEGRPDGRAESHWLAAEAQVSHDNIEQPAKAAAARKTAVTKKLKS